jgi:hypothetical protein
MYSPFHPVPRGTHNVLHLLTRQTIGDLIRRICFLRGIGNRALLKELIKTWRSAGQTTQQSIWGADDPRICHLDRFVPLDRKQ